MKLKALVLAIVLAMGVGVAVAAPVMAVQCPPDSARPNAEVSSYAECSLPKKEDDQDLITTVVKILNVAVGIATVVTIGVMVIGGIFYVISTGDTAKTTRAKNTIMYGLIGLVVCMLAFAIVNFVVTNVFGGSGSGGSAVVKPGAQTTKPGGTTAVPVEK